MDLLKGLRKRRRERLHRLYERHKRIRALLKEHAEDILESKNFKGTRAHIQHGSMTVHNHCMDVARYSLLINKKLGVGCNKHDLIRGALLHDYFLYDWHDKAYLANRQRLHGFHHPMTALKNAEKEYHQKAYVASVSDTAHVQRSLGGDGSRQVLFVFGDGGLT